MNCLFARGSRMVAKVRLPFAVLATLALSAGCVHDLLKFEAPDRVQSSILDGPANIPLLVNSAVGDFECAFQQYVIVTGQVSDELDNGNLASAEAFQLDRRSVNKERTHYALYLCGTEEGILTPIETARYDADQVLLRLAAASDADVPNRTSLTATAAAYSGYSYILLGEGFCSAAVDGGPELTAAQVFTIAEQKFTQAITAAQTSGNASMLNLSYTGRARARLDMGNTAGALADAQLVPAGFVINAKTSGAATRAFNRVFASVNQNSSLIIGAAFRNLTYGGVADPRVPVANANRLASDNTNPMWIQNKYLSRDAPIPLASYQEAQLIVAEVSGGQTAVNIINALHTARGLPATFASNDPATIMAQVIDERKRELFLQSQRFYDINRFNLPLDPAPGTSYGYKGGFYGDMRCFPLPDVERLNNPTLSGG